MYLYIRNQHIHAQNCKLQTISRTYLWNGNYGVGTPLHIGSEIWGGILISIINVTRSQAVARIADRTAKNCKGHVT